MTKKKKKQVNVENQAIKFLSKEELIRKIEVIKKELRSYTRRDLETNGKFAKSEKLSFITHDMLIAVCDIGCETHYIRAIDVRGRELSSGAFEFSNTSEGFANANSRQQSTEKDAVTGVIACKILRVIYTILKTGTAYDPQKLLKDIKRPATSQAPMAA